MIWYNHTLPGGTKNIIRVRAQEWFELFDSFRDAYRFLWNVIIEPMQLPMRAMKFKNQWFVPVFSHKEFPSDTPSGSTGISRSYTTLDGHQKDEPFPFVMPPLPLTEADRGTPVAQGVVYTIDWMPSLMRHFIKCMVRPHRELREELEVSDSSCM
jgi:hypothetical protein